MQKQELFSNVSPKGVLHALAFLEKDLVKSHEWRSRGREQMEFWWDCENVCTSGGQTRSVLGLGPVLWVCLLCEIHPTMNLGFLCFSVSIFY